MTPLIPRTVNHSGAASFSNGGSNGVGDGGDGGLQALLASLNLGRSDGSVPDTAVDQVADTLRRQLGLTGDTSMYTSLAKEIIKLQIGKNESPKPNALETTIGEEPTWSSDGSSPEHSEHSHYRHRSNTQDDETSSNYSSRHLSPAPTPNKKPGFFRSGGSGNNSNKGPTIIHPPKTTVEGRDRGRSPSRAQSGTIRTKSRSRTPLGMGAFFGGASNNNNNNNNNSRQSREERTTTPDRRSPSPMAAAIGKMFRRTPAATDGAFPTFDNTTSNTNTNTAMSHSLHERRTPPIDRRGIPRPNSTTDPRELLKMSPPPPPPNPPPRPLHVSSFQQPQQQPLPPQQMQSSQPSRGPSSPGTSSPLRWRPVPLPTEVAAAERAVADMQRSNHSLHSIVEERIRQGPSVVDKRQSIFNTGGPIHATPTTAASSSSSAHNYPSVANAPSFDEDNTDLKCPSSMSIESRDTGTSSSTTITTNKAPVESVRPPFHSPDSSMRTPPLDKSNRGRSQGRIKELQQRSARSLSIQRSTPPPTTTTTTPQSKRRSPSPFGLKSLFGRSAAKTSGVVDQMESVAEAAAAAAQTTWNGNVVMPNATAAPPVAGFPPMTPSKNVRNPSEPTNDDESPPQGTPTKMPKNDDVMAPPPPPAYSPGMTPPLRSHSLPPGSNIRRPSMGSPNMQVAHNHHQQQQQQQQQQRIPPTPNTSPAMTEVAAPIQQQPTLLQPGLLKTTLEDVCFNLGSRSSNRDLFYKKVANTKRSKSASAGHRTESVDSDDMVSIPPPFRAGPNVSTLGDRNVDVSTPSQLHTSEAVEEQQPASREGSPMEVDEILPADRIGVAPPIEFKVGVGERKPINGLRRTEHIHRAKMLRQRKNGMQRAGMPNNSNTNNMMADDQEDSTSTSSSNSPPREGQQQESQQQQQPSFRSASQPPPPTNERAALVSEQASSSPTNRQPVEEVDHSGKRGLVNRLREQAKSFYLAKDFRGSILNYTSAIKVHTTGGTSGRDDVLAVLLSNRAAGLVMVGAYGAAASDCDQALQYVTDSGAELSSDSGPVLRAKLHARMGKSFLKMGQTDKAEAEFQNALRVGETTLKLSREIRDPLIVEQHQNLFAQVMTEATLGKSESTRLRDTLDKLASCARMSSFRNAERRSSVEALSHVNMALATAYGSEELHEKKVKSLVTLKRWREVACHCERLAAELVKLDGVFSEDLSSWQPTPPLPPVRALNPAFFGETREDDAAGALLKLSPKASADAVMRLPYSLMPHYVRSLRLEERYPCAEAAISALEEYVKSHSGIQEQQMRVRFAWLSREKDKINRTKQGRERGDELFRSGDYNLASAQYASCLTIDGEGLAPDPDGNNAGGRLHAVLNCNRAASLMAVKRFEEAVTECSAALRIHTRYMKAMLRRGRCYWRLERHDEAIEEYKKWLELVEEARRLPPGTIFVTPCLFDGPSEVSNDDHAQVKQELDEITKAKFQAESAAKAEESYRQERSRWYHDNIPNSGADDAQTRREQWYNQKGSAYRRWDSFEGKTSPPRAGRSHSAHSHTYQSKRSYSWRAPNESSTADGGAPKGSARDEGASRGTRDEGASRGKVQSPGSDESITHYAVLEVSMTATEAEIKKSYRKLALLHHPDKNMDPKAAENFRRIKMAYEVLIDEFARRKYDLGLKWNNRRL